MFTPCPKELNEAAAKRLEARRLAEARPVINPATGKPITAHIAGRAPRPKLCHDLRGLYTPCTK